MVDAQHTPAELDRAARVKLAAHIVTYANMLEVQKQSWADEAHVTKTKTMLAELTLLATLCGEGNQLLFFDIFDGHVRCALTTAPLELCEQLAIFVPGVGTTAASSLPYYISELSNLAKLADSQNVQMHKTARTAAVAWFGYTAPQPTVTSAASRITSPASQECAVEGGEQLVQFCQLLPGGKTTTLIGHSYGSVVVSQALRTARTQNVNIAEKVVFVGSPGLGVDDLSVLGVKPGNVFLLEGAADPVAGLGWFEKDPDQLVGITELSTQEHGTLTSSKFHSRYLKSGTTSQHNIAAVICGNATIPRTGDTVGTRIGRGIKMPIRRLARAYRPEKTQTPDM